MGYVYILLEVDKHGHERYKIGHSKNHPEKRVKQLSTGNSNIISLLNFYETDNYKKIERWLHRDFASKKTEANNEWFSLDDEQVLGFIDRCKWIDKTVKLLLEQNPFYK
jgi:hypothetical protein